MSGASIRWKTRPPAPPPSRGRYLLNYGVGALMQGGGNFETFLDRIKRECGAGFAAHVRREVEMQAELFALQERIAERASELARIAKHKRRLERRQYQREHGKPSR